MIILATLFNICHKFIQKNLICKIKHYFCLFYMLQLNFDLWQNWLIFAKKKRYIYQKALNDQQWH